MNQDFDTGQELRLQSVFTQEIWHKLKSLDISPDNLNNKQVLDLCCGTGYLTYHLLKQAPKANVTLIDISPDEVNMAKRLLGKEPRYVIGDVTKTSFPNNSFDVVIGNSFLHHFYDLPAALKEILRIIKPGGVFISLHEPKPLAIPLEKASLNEYLQCLLNQETYVDSIRYKGPGDVVKESGTDVWMFKPSELVDIMTDVGFKPIKVANWNIFRPYIIAKQNLHLTAEFPKYTDSQEQLFRKQVKRDALLSRFLPSIFFGSFAIMGHKPDAN